MIRALTDFDLGYRPYSYWGPQDLETHFGAKAKGELRRQAGLALLGEGIADEAILASSLPDDERAAVGAHQGYNDAFPARAGMNRWCRHPRRRRGCVPRTRGDEPITIDGETVPNPRSPHARG